MSNKGVLKFDNLTMLTKQARTFLGDIKTGSVFVKGETARYIEAGKGETIILIHGFGTSKHGWRMLMQSLQKRYRLIALEVPGLSYECRQNRLKSFSVNNLLDFIDAFAGKLGVEKFHLLGHSAGSAVAAYYSLKFPNKVLSLAFMSMPMLFKHPDEPHDDASEFADFLVPRTKEGVKEMIDFVAHRPFNIPQRYLDKIAVDNEIHGEARLIVIREILRKTTLLVPQLHRISVPVVLIYGEFDRVLPSSSIDYLSATVRSIQTYMIPDVGHAPYFEEPVESSAVYQSFLKFVESGDDVTREVMQ